MLELNHEFQVLDSKAVNFQNVEVEDSLKMLAVIYLHTAVVPFGPDLGAALGDDGARTNAIFILV